uniref:RNA-directed DNA polymerase, eukaryota, reverse transcriptase zinc-binding domain protein n=1 Tax=Tanacetum cinerariifolium TaxID=118510 RepID=A0A6L2JBW3_TANCI|nr:RNA-directed DNA polymerase, eukaryota, reverse transcriptase zinc-binding domain protein [Tanacetum cinerariifolium]
MYKVVTKILANRLALVIADLVFDTQFAFVANRQVLDGLFILNEILYWCKRKKKQATFFKVDFAKACDSVRWDYLLDVLEAFGFGQTWCTWIRVGECLFKGVHLQGSISISHLFYADDAMFIGEWSDGGVCMSRHQAWDDTVLKLRSRLSNWKVKTLSIGGRLTLLKSVLGASPLYNMSIFKVPKGILKSMEAIRSKIFNGIDSAVKKITWAAWDKILASKINGGLGVSSFHALNRALLLKWVWRFISQDGSLWFRVIQALYGPSIVYHPVNLSSNWCSIVRELHLLTDKDVLWAGFEHQQMVDLNSLLESVSLSQSRDRWFYDLTCDGEFRVKDMRVSPDHYSPDMSMVGVGLAGSYVLFGLAELVFFYSSSV